MAPSESLTDLLSMAHPGDYYIRVQGQAVMVPGLLRGSVALMTLRMARAEDICEAWIQGMGALIGRVSLLHARHAAHRIRIRGVLVAWLPAHHDRLL